MKFSASSIQELFNNLSQQVYPDCSNVNYLEASGFDVDSISLGFFLAMGANVKQAQRLVEAFDGQFSTLDELAAQLQNLE